MVRTADGLAVLGEVFVPHYRSAGHPETTAIDHVVARHQAEGTAYRTCMTGKP